VNAGILYKKMRENTPPWSSISSSSNKRPPRRIHRMLCVKDTSSIQGKQLRPIRTRHMDVTRIQEPTRRQTDSRTYINPQPTQGPHTINQRKNEANRLIESCELAHTSKPASGRLQHVVILSRKLVGHKQHVVILSRKLLILASK
jgi:hypothetical protein